MRVHGPKLFGDWRDFGREYAHHRPRRADRAARGTSGRNRLEWHQKVDAAVADMNNELSAGDGPQAYARLAMHDCVERAPG